MLCQTLTRVIGGLVGGGEDRRLGVAVAWDIAAGKQWACCVLQRYALSVVWVHKDKDKAKIDS